jgi:DNA-binding HxlR family transcriptional regulator
MPMIRNEDNAYIILLALSESDKRFSDLIKEAKKASVALELDRLQKMRLISRTVSDSKPPSTRYSITKLGKDFLAKQAEIRIPKLAQEISRLKKEFPEQVKQAKI